MKLPPYMYRTPVILKKASGELNGAGEPILSAPTSLRVMWQDKKSITRSKKSQQEGFNCLIYSPIALGKDDILVKDSRDHIVLDVKQIDDLMTGKPIYWEVRV